MDSIPSDLVLDSRIQVEFSDNVTYRFTFQSRASSGQYFRRKPRKDTWQTVKLLGSGSYGTVSLHRCLTSEGKAELQAVKKIEKAVVAEGIDYYRELEAIAKFSQKKYEGLFVEFIGWYENDKSVFIIMEYMEYGDLDLHLKRPLPENEAREVTLQIAEGLKLLHENGFAHRDLKPANIFVFRKGPGWWVKIGDFGFSKRVDEKDGLRSCVGTPVFLAPEVHMLYSPSRNDQGTVLQYTEKVDIWALGAITFYMVFHDYPFSPRKSITLQQYMQGEAFPFPKSRLSEISKACKSFIKAAMAPDASKRLSAKQATENEWLMRADFQLGEMAAVKIKKEKLSACISTERSQEVREPIRKHTSDDSNNDNISPAGGNIRAHVLPWNIPESPTRREYTAVKLYPSEDRVDSPSSEDPIQLQLQELQSLHSQGVQHFRQNDFEKAELMLRQAAIGRKKLRGFEHEETRNSYHCLAVLYYHMSRYSRAKELFQWVLGYQEREYGPKGISTLKSRYWIGVLTIREGNNQEGLSILQQVVEVQEDVLGPNHPETLLSLSAIEHHKPQILGNPPQKSNSPRLLEIDKATSSMQQTLWKLTPLLRRSCPNPQKSPRKPAVKMRGMWQGKQTVIVVRLPPKSPQPLPKHKPGISESSKVEHHYRTMAELGQRLHGQGDYNAAQSHLKLAASGLKTTLGSTHADSLDALYWLGRNQYELCHYQTAEVTFRKVASRRTESLGTSHKKTLNSLHALGLALSKQGKDREAESVFRSAFQGLEQISDKYDRDLVHALFQIGFTLYKQGNPKEAEPILQDTLKRRDFLLGPRTEDTIECAFWRGRALFDLKRYPESEEVFGQALTPIQDTRSMATSHWLGLAMYCQEKYEQAIPFLHRAFSLRNAKRGKHDLDTLSSSYWLGLAYYHQARYAEARHFLFLALVGMKERSGLPNQDTLDCLYWYVEVLQARDTYEPAVEMAQQELLRGHMMLFDLKYPRSIQAIKRWVRSLEPQQKFLEAKSEFQGSRT